MNICEKLYHAQTMTIQAYTCGRLKTETTESMSCFPLNDSNIIIIAAKSISPIYQIYPLIWIKRESMYIAENIIKLKKVYIIGRGNTGTWYGTGVYGLL